LEGIFQGQKAILTLRTVRIALKQLFGTLLWNFPSNRIACPHISAVLRIRAQIQEEVRALVSIHASIQELQDKHHGSEFAAVKSPDHVHNTPETWFGVEDPFVSLLGISVSLISPISVQFMFYTCFKKQFILVLDRFGIVDGVEKWSTGLCHLPAFFNHELLKYPKSEKEWMSVLPLVAEYVVVWEKRRIALQKLQEEFGDAVSFVSYNASRSTIRFFIRDRSLPPSAISGFLELMYEDDTSSLPTRVRRVDVQGLTIESLSLCEIVERDTRRRVESEAQIPTNTEQKEGAAAPWSSSDAAWRACNLFLHTLLNEALLYPWSISRVKE